MSLLEIIDNSLKSPEILFDILVATLYTYFIDLSDHEIVQLPAIRIPRRYTVVRQVAPKNKQKNTKNTKEQFREIQYTIEFSLN